MTTIRFIVMVALVLLVGCAGESSPVDAEAPIETSAQSGPATITVTLDRDSMRTVDRLQVLIDAQAIDGAEIAMPLFDPEDQGWTVITRTDRPLLMTDAGPARRTELVLEPFLEGVYEVPPATLEWTLESGELGVVSTEPLRVQVASVLGSDDTGELAGPIGIVHPDPPEPESGSAVIFVVAGMVVLGIVAVMVWRFMRGIGRVERASFVEGLKQLRDTNVADADEIGAAVSDALRRSGNTSLEARSVLDEFDRARFGREPVTPQRSRELLDEGIAILDQPARTRGLA